MEDRIKEPLAIDSVVKLIGEAWEIREIGPFSVEMVAVPREAVNVPEPVCSLKLEFLLLVSNVRVPAE